MLAEPPTCSAPEACNTMSPETDIRRLRAQNWRLCDRLEKCEAKVEALTAELSVERARVAALTSQPNLPSAMFEGLNGNDSVSDSAGVTCSNNTSADSAISSQSNASTTTTPLTAATVPAPTPEQHQRLLWVLEGVLDALLQRVKDGESLCIPAFGPLDVVDGQPAGAVDREGLIKMYRAALDPAYTKPLSIPTSCATQLGAGPVTSSHHPDQTAERGNTEDMHAEKMLESILGADFTKKPTAISSIDAQSNNDSFQSASTPPLAPKSSNTSDLGAQQEDDDKTARKEELKRRRLEKRASVQENIARVLQNPDDIGSWDRLAASKFKNPFTIKDTTYVNPIMCQAHAALLAPNVLSRWKTLATQFTSHTHTLTVGGIPVTRRMAEVRCLEIGGESNEVAAKRWVYLGENLAMSQTVEVSGTAVNRFTCFSNAVILSPMCPEAWLGVAELLPKGGSIVVNNAKYDNFSSYAMALSLKNTMETAWFHLSMILPDNGFVIIGGLPVTKKQCTANFEALRAQHKANIMSLVNGKKTKAERRATRKLLKEKARMF